MFLLAISFKWLSAQNSQKDYINKSVVSKGPIEGYVLYVYCNGLQVDELFSTPPFHNVDHYQKGTWVWLNSMNLGEATSLKTGEIFKVKDFDRIVLTNSQDLEGFVISRVNLIGDRGSHYIGTVIYDFPSWEITSVVKANCPEAGQNH